MTVELSFVPGTFQSFRAKTRIHLGKLQTNVNEGDIVQFDGQVLRVAGADHSYPEFRAGVKAGWVVPVEDNISNYRPKAAGVAVRGAQDASRKVSTVVSEDDTFVAPARRPKVVREEDREPEEKEVKRFAVKREDDMGLNVAPARPTAKRTVETSGMDGLNEDAKPVGRIATPASQKTVIADASAAAREASRLDNAPPPRAVLATKTDIHAAASDKIENILEAADPATRARMLAEARKAAVSKSEAAENPTPSKESPKAREAPKPAPSKETAPKAEKKAAAPAPVSAPRMSAAAPAPAPAAVDPLAQAAIEAASRVFVLAKRWERTGQFDRAEMEAAKIAAQVATAAAYHAASDAAAATASNVAYYIGIGRDADARTKLTILRQKLIDLGVNVAALEAQAAPAPKPKLQPPPQTVEEFVIRDGLVEIHPGVMWDKSLHWRSRAKIALDQYASNPEALAAIRAYETPAVVQLIDTNAGRKG